jgi:ABC-type glycerol-3-phosphate transport system substrate-binding protein
MKTLAALMLSALVLAGCGERPQERAGQKITGSAPSWQGPATAFTARGWTVGDQGSWTQHMQTRAQGQNEFSRIRPGS